MGDGWQMEACGILVPRPGVEPNRQCEHIILTTGPSWNSQKVVLLHASSWNKSVEMVCVKVAQLCSTLCDPMDHTVHWILQARMLEWGAFPFSRGLFQPRDQTWVSLIAGRFFTIWATRKAQEYWSGWPIPSPEELPELGVEPGSPALQADSLPTEL